MNLSVKVFGKVQNVSLRKNIFQEALKLNLNEWVKNSSDPSVVEMVFEGNKKYTDSILKFIKSCHGKSIIEDIKTNQGKEKIQWFQNLAIKWLLT